jgi:hypothetical protein
MAASALAIGLRMDPVQALPLGGKIAGPEAAVQQVQLQEKRLGTGQGPGMGSRGQGGTLQGLGEGKMRSNGGAIREGGTQLRSGESGMRGEAGTRLRGQGLHSERGGAEFGYKGRRGYGYGPGFGERPRFYRDGHRHRFHGHDRFEPGYGYRSGCGWLRRRALETDSPYWWRRYRACRGH